MRMRWTAVAAAALAAGWLGQAAPARADVPSLQLAPLQYESALTPGHISTGYIDVANPSDTTVTIVSSVRGFRQVGHDGDLEFYEDSELNAAIKPGLDQFSLGPREAVRVVFSVDGGKLPPGGTYAAIFFRTVPPEQAGSGSSYVAESANVGTLLILTNGSGAARHGEVTNLHAPLWQWGDHLTGGFSFANTDRSAHPVGFKPQLSVRVMPWGHRQATPTGLVLPGTTRDFDFARAGAYFGLVPVTVTDADTESRATVWVLACTGWYRVVAPLALVALTGGYLWRRLRPRRVQPLANDDETAEAVT